MSPSIYCRRSTFTTLPGFTAYVVTSDNMCSGDTIMLSGDTIMLSGDTIMLSSDNKCSPATIYAARRHYVLSGDNMCCPAKYMLSGDNMSCPATIYGVLRQYDPSGDNMSPATIYVATRSFKKKKKSKHKMRILGVNPRFSSYKTTLKQQLIGENEIRTLICFTFSCLELLFWCPVLTHSW